VSFNPDEFRLKGDRPPMPQPKPAAKAPPPKRKPFVVKWVALPGWWIEALEGASAGAHQLALVILREEYKLKHSPFPGAITLSERVTKMTHSTRERARLELVSLGLIEVEQKGNQAFVATKVHHFPKMGNRVPLSTSLLCSLEYMQVGSRLGR
jgi:hypothetical protein